MYLEDYMKYLLSKLLISFTGIALVHPAAITYNSSIANAQEAEGCFMVNASGHTVSLNNLCGIAEEKVAEIPAERSLVTPNVFRAKIKRRNGGTPVIEVTFNDKHKFEMLLDTGASQTTITQEMANALKVVPVGVMKAGVASGDVVKFPVGKVSSISVDGAVVKDQMVAIAPLPLLGQNFFGRYEVTIKRDVVEFHAL